MKTDPTISIAGPAASSLAYQAIELGNQAASQANLKPNPSTAITDVVETSDRDGQQQLTSDSGTATKPPKQSSNPAPENGGLLDLTG